MSVRDALLRRQQDASDADQDNAVRIKRDVMIYRAAMAKLSAKIELWLSDTGVQAECGMMPCRDEAIATLSASVPNHYDITRTIMTGQGRRAVLRALGLYGSGALGQARLTVFSPIPPEEDRDFILGLERTGVWFIRREGPGPEKSEPLSEARFLAAVAPLLPPTDGADP